MHEFPNTVQMLDRRSTDMELVDFGSIVPRGRIGRALKKLLLRARLFKYREGTVEVVTYHNMQSRNLLGAIETAMKDRYRYERTRPKAVYIGCEAFEELTGNEAFRQMAYNSGPWHNGPEVYGLPITVCPWMKGILVV